MNLSELYTERNKLLSKIGRLENILSRQNVWISELYDNVCDAKELHRDLISILEREASPRKREYHSEEEKIAKEARSSLAVQILNHISQVPQSRFLNINPSAAGYIPHRNRQQLEKRIRELEAMVDKLEGEAQDVSEETFHALWMAYGAAPDDTLTIDAQALKRRLWQIVGKEEGGASI
jgi:vacuolar-type H+-ATPase subunit H